MFGKKLTSTGVIVSKAQELFKELTGKIQRERERVK
jgi:hypothetical protein